MLVLEKSKNELLIKRINKLVRDFNGGKLESNCSFFGLPHTFRDGYMTSFKRGILKHIEIETIQKNEYYSKYFVHVSLSDKQRHTFVVKLSNSNEIEYL